MLEGGEKPTVEKKNGPGGKRNGYRAKGKV